MSELLARVVRGTDGWLRFEEAPGDDETEAWIAAGPESTADLEGRR